MSMQTLRFRLSLLATVTSLVLLAACGQGGGEPATSPTATEAAGEESPGSPMATETIPIGLVTDLSGDTAEIGEQLRAAAEFAVEYINSNGGVKITEDSSAQLELSVDDSRGVAESAVAAFSRLVDEESIVAGIGALTTPPTFAVGQEAQRLKVPLVVDTAAGEQLVTSGLEYLFRLSQGAGQEGEAQIRSLETIEEALGSPIERIAFLGWDGTSFVDDELSRIQELADEMGIEVAEVVRFTEGQPSYSSEVSRINAADPDAVLWCVLGIPEAVQVVRDYVQQGLDPLQTPLVNCSVSLTDPSFRESAGDLAHGLYTVQGWFSGLDGVRTDFWNEFEEATGFEIYDLPAFEVQAVFTIKAAIEECGCTDPETINTTLHEMVIEADSPNYVLQPGTGIEFDENGVNQRVLVGVYQWQQDELVPVWPDDIAGGDPVVE